MPDEFIAEAPLNTDPTPEPEASSVEHQTEGDAPTEPQLSDEDYRLNFLGTDKFELAKETPEEIRSALKNLEKSLNKGWTEKNMKLAEERREAFAAQQQAAIEAELSRTVLKEMGKLEALQDQLKAYDDVNWSAWIAQDPEAANKALLNLQTLKMQRDKLGEEVTAKQREAANKQVQQAREWLAKSEERVQTRIRDWGEPKQKELQSVLAEHYLNTGTPMDQGAYQAIAWHPGLVEMAHDAMLYRRSLEKASKDSKPTSPIPVVVPKVGGAAQATKNPDKMTDAEWVEWRNAQLERKQAPRNR